MGGRVGGAESAFPHYRGCSHGFKTIVSYHKIRQMQPLKNGEILNKLHFTEDSNSNTIRILDSQSVTCIHVAKMALLTVLTSVTDPTTKAWTFLWAGMHYINSCLVKEITRKKSLREQSNYNSLKKELQYLQCEYCPQQIYCHRTQRVKTKERCSFRLMKPSCLESLSQWVGKEQFE